MSNWLTRASASALRLPATAISTFRKFWLPVKLPAPMRFIPAMASYQKMPALPRFWKSTRSASSDQAPSISASRGDKIAAKQTAKRLGIPVVPGSEGGVDTPEEAKRVAAEMGYPVLIKAASGGGGKGMQVVHSEDQINLAFTTARSEAAANFGDSTVYIEKYLEKPRHIEVQVMGDGKGHAIHLGERDCSLQRRHQKVWEEAQSPALNEEQQKRIGDICAKAMQGLGYSGAGNNRVSL